MIEECISQFSKAGFFKGFRTVVLVYIGNQPEAKNALEEYLSLKQNLKTKEDYKRIFVTYSSLTNILINGLYKAGWNPKK